MTGRLQRMWFVLAAVFTAASTAGCAIRVKVSENWNRTYAKPIPLGESVAAWNTIESGRMPEPEALEAYNDAVRITVVQVANNWLSEQEALAELETTSGPARLDVRAVNVRNVDLIEEIIPARFVHVKQGLRSDTKVEGVGASLLVRQRWSEEDPMIPKTGLWYPVTGVLDLDEPGQPVLNLIDPTTMPYLTSGGGRVPLEADYTATFARDFQDRQNLFLDMPSMLKYEKFADRTGLYRFSAFDPHKTACILIHGINSSPSTWEETLNEMYADPEIREEYEFWTFGYPTGAPIPYLASVLREEINKMIAFRQREGATDLGITIIGHSMGGLLAKAMTQSSGDEDWNRFFKVPIGQLEVSDENREVLRKMVYYEPISRVEKVVLVATPHRGSTLADKAIARLVGDLIQLPTQLAVLSNDVVQESRYALTPLGARIAENRPSSIDQLRTTFLDSADYLIKPLNPDVKFYSLIGNKHSADTPPEKMTDGVVPYSSAHIEGVESEIIVHDSPHGVHRERKGIEELVRILKLP